MNVKTYAAYYNDETIRKFSSSGGVFSALAHNFDVVYGVAMTEDCYGAKFIRVEGDISPLRGSKYFQASMGDTFKCVRDDLIAGKRVLFSGTGCQINGLALFLRKEYSNLLLVDVICHGTPSPKLWEQYVLHQERKYGKIKSVNFRAKDISWEDFGIKENQVYISKNKDSFMRMFLRNYSLRPSCYKCHAKNYKLSDITIGDFWGIDYIDFEMNDHKGINLVIVRTEKGQKFFKEIQDKVTYKEVRYNDAIKGNLAEYASVDKPVERDMFYKDFQVMTFKKLEKKYVADVPLLLRCVRKIKRTLKLRML